MNIGERHEIEDELWECMSLGVLGDDGGFDAREGRVPEVGDEGMLIQSVEHPDNVYWMERAEHVDARNRTARLEMAMDELMPGTRAELLRYEEEGVVPFEAATRLLRAACAAGYEFGLSESSPGALRESFE